ncbi:MAG: FAD-dependent oxidoreductase [Actinomycetota bacterium]|nr:FAD-dependent oxidoreductase [Actinomycetota bacterium]
MAEIIVIGSGIGGLSSAMLLAGDGHDATVLERDPAAPPGDPEQAWEDWGRRGVGQFRMLHLFLPRFRALLESELPEAAKAIEAAGALRFNAVAGAPTSMTGGARGGDDDFESITGRRPVVEAALAGTAESTPGLRIRRGVAVAALRTGTEAVPGVPQVTGVVTEDGEELAADLVVDATGRRSPLPRWLKAIGAGACEEELDDSGFVYYGRHFRSSDGSVPPMMSGLLSHYGSVSVLTLPADHGTWGVGIIGSGGDAELRNLRHVDRWEAALNRFPLVAHWADAEPIDDGVAVMAKIEDRIRHTVVDGRPVATGVVTVADSWACTNPSLGRGASMALLHALELRDLLRRQGTDDPAGLAMAWDEATRAAVEPLYRSTLHYDRHRLAEVDAAIKGKAYEPDDVAWEMTRALQFGSMQDPDLFRGFLRVVGLLSTPDEVFAQPGMADKVISVGAGWRDEEVFGPTRQELVELVA